MYRKLIPIAAAAAALFAQAPLRKATALDKPALETYLRHLFVWPPEQVQMTVNDPLPGPMAGFFEVKVRGSSGPQGQDEVFYVSKDGQRIVRGVFYDINQNPFKNEIDKIKTTGQPSFGTAGAPVVIAEFSDFECPFCREEAKTLRDNLLKTYPTQVHVYFFDFPLETMHPWARPAAIAGRCVFRQSPSAYWDFHDWMFENQKDITADNLKEKVLGFAKTKEKDVDGAQLTACIDTKATSAEVDKTIAIGQSLQVNQTPTTFINGRRLAGTVAWNDIKYIIDFEIGYQKTAKNAGEDCGCDVKLPTFSGDKPSIAPGLHK
ncbi:MAG: DsbA family protein [Acidobacteriota bacterium]|nr:DsbA family protein [Acidobacteriota bacterium]